MKPISLKIKGLNSFIEEQNIDFLTLTDRGLFGIFGPTGSGKTTILDGITLALYGEVSRKSTNYINTNCDKSNIHYEFQISGSENKIYSVDREFKRDKNTGNIKSGKCKLCDITNGEPIILAEKVKEVTNKCIEIIGLSLDDFTRTVVLPQGKFSEFLKLEGKNRREMLERLFNLQQYGDDLSFKLSREINKNRKEYDILLGEMKGYEDVSNEKLKSLRDKYAELSNRLQSANDEYKIIEKVFAEGKEVWDLQVEVNSYINKESELKEKANEFEDKEKKIHLAQSAFKVLPYIVSYEETKDSLIKCREKEIVLKEEVKLLKDDKEKKDNLYREIQKEKEEQLPLLKVKESQAKEALEEKKSLEKVIEDINKCNELKEKLVISKNNYTNDLNNIDKKLEGSTILIKEKEELVDSLKIDNELIDAIQRGRLFSNKCTEINKRIEVNNIKIKKITENINKELLNKEEIESCKLNLVSEYENNKKVYNELINACPGDEKDLLIMQEELNKLKEGYNNYNKYIVEKESTVESIKQYKIELNELNKKQEEYSRIINNLKKEKKEVEILILSHKLRNELKEGSPCPVCGSTHHNKDNILDIENDNSLELDNKICDNEEVLKNISNRIIVLNNNICRDEERIKSLDKDISGLNIDFSKLDLEKKEKEFNDLRINSENYKKQKESLEKKDISLREELSKVESNLSRINVIIEEGNKQVAVYNKENEEFTNDFNKDNSELQKIITQTNVIDFEMKNKEINDIEVKRETLTKEIKELRSNEESLNSNKELCKTEINNLNERIIKGESMIEEKQNIVLEKEALIISKIGEEKNISLYIEKIQKDILELETKYNIAEKDKEEINNKYNLTNENLITLVSKINELLNREKEEESKLKVALVEEKFEDIDIVKSSVIDSDMLKLLQESVETYKSNILKVRGAIESLQGKLNNRCITIEEWNNIQNNKIEKEEEIKVINSNKIKKEEEIKNLELKLKSLESLIIEKEKLDHKLALLNDLDKLFKGKKFVEYVALSRLKYISKEASKKLKEITNENYGLEIDENGKFIIRDYKNGGVGRDASTLSGGETFLASLSLALALSAQIQLKGTAPLELFFLDEGFGTLDDNLLDVVMGSLERIHNDKLKVGIISHVESIKNRVPVKLILSPAEAGKGGSKAKIERS